MMNNGNNRPLSKKKTVQILVALTILAWATQTLFHQWGYGQQETAANEDAAAMSVADEPLSPEKFVPGTPRFAAGATLELRAEATVVGSDVKLRQICRWSKNDESIFAPMADLVVARFAQKAPFRSVSVQEIKGTLHDAGANLAVIKFAGATSCTIARSDVEYNEATALQQWIDAKESVIADATSPAATQPAAAADTATAASSPAAPGSAGDSVAAPDDKPHRTLRDVLIADLSARTSIPADQLQVDFLARSERLLNLSEPHFRFTVEPRRSEKLGDVRWDVEIASDGSSQKATVEAFVRVWQDQLIVARPLSYRQLIQDADVIERRTLVEDVGDHPLLTRTQAVGQQAARDLKPGTILNSRSVDAVPLVRTGQLVTVVIRQGSVEIKSVARAMEAGAFGQTIRAKNESTKDIFEVVVTGPQTARMGAADDSDSTPVTASDVASLDGN